MDLLTYVNDADALYITGEDTVDVSGMFDAGDADPSMEATACNPKFPRTCVRP